MSMPNNDSIVLGLLLTGNFACITYFFRTIRVWKERKKVLNILQELCLYDVTHGKDYSWRLKEFDSISYLEMLLPFWINVECFFKDKKCLIKSEINI